MQLDSAPGQPGFEEQPFAVISVASLCENATTSLAHLEPGCFY